MSAELAARLDKMAARIRAVTADTTLSVEGQAIALGMIVSIYLPVIEEAADALGSRRRGHER